MNAIRWNLKEFLKKTVVFLTSGAMLITGVATGFGSMTALADNWQDSGVPATTYADGSGTSDDPYQISTAAQLAYLAQEVNSGSTYEDTYFELIDDIDLSACDWTPIGTSEYNFDGTFNGAGHEITDLTIGTEDDSDSTLTYAGLFGFVGEDGVIEDTGVVDAAIYTSASSVDVGEIVGYNKGTVINCYATGSAVGGSSANVGSLAGYSTGAVENCYATGSVTGGSDSYVGGLVGVNASTITNCYAVGDVTGGSDAYVGGIVGGNDDATITAGYYNSDATQIVDSTESDTTKGVGYGDDVSTGESSDYMTSSSFVTLLNGNIDSNTDWFSWMLDSADNNDGYPVLTYTYTLNAYATAGSVSGSTKIIVTDTLDDDDTLAYKVSSSEISTPDVGDTVSGTKSYTSGKNITGVSAGKYIGVYELDSDDEVVKFTLIKLTSDEIKNAASTSTLAAYATAGTVSGSTKIIVTDTLDDDDTLAYKVSSSKISTPDVGDTVSGTKSYTSGKNITGVSAGKYIGVYELDSDDEVVKFTLIKLTSDEIKNAASTSTLAAYATAGSVSGSTKIIVTDTLDDDDTLAYKVSSSKISTPDVGDTVSGTKSYTSGKNITGVSAGKYIGVYELDSDDEVVKFTLIKLTSDEIKNAASTSTLAAYATAGSVSGSTKIIVTDTLDDDDTLAYKVSSSKISTPDVGDTVSGTKSYTSGKNITGVSAGKYIGVYELDSDDEVVGFTLIKLTSDEIKNAASTSTLAAYAAAGSVSGSTKIIVTNTLDDDDTLAYKVSSSKISTPDVGDEVHGATEYFPGDDITDVSSGKYIGVYELDSDDEVVGFTLIKLKADQIGDSDDSSDNPVKLTSLYATATAGSVSGSTKIIVTGTWDDGDTLAYKISSSKISTPDVGDEVYGATGYFSGDDITDVSAGQYIGVYELDSDDEVVGFTLIKLKADQIGDSDDSSDNPVKLTSLYATAIAGSVFGSTKITVTGTWDDGDTLAYKISSSKISTPDVGDEVYGATEYFSGDDITDVSAGQYIGVYELDSDDEIVGFTLIKLTAGQINANSDSNGSNNGDDGSDNGDDGFDNGNTGSNNGFDNGNTGSTNPKPIRK